MNNILDSFEALQCGKEIWTGSIPTKFTLCITDVTALVPPEPIYV
jgi:hypothetical protein